MQNDSPDTISTDETQWQHTVVDDMFMPSVKVLLRWKDVESAVEKGAVVPQHAHALWATWASPDSGLRFTMQDSKPAAEHRQAPLHAEYPASPAPGGPLRRHGLAIGLLAGIALGATGAALLGG